MQHIDSDESEWVEISPEEAAYAAMERRVRAGRKPNAKTLPELGDHIVDFVSMRFSADALEPTGVTLAEINRRFGVAATRLGSSARELCLSLMRDCRIVLEPYRTSIVAYPKEDMDSYLIPYAEAGPETLHKMRTVIVARALRPAPVPDAD